MKLKNLFKYAIIISALFVFSCDKLDTPEDNPDDDITDNPTGGFTTDPITVTGGGSSSGTTLKIVAEKDVVSDVTDYSATVSGRFTQLDASDPIAHYGYVWSTNPYPSLLFDSKIDLGARTETGAFNTTVTGLNPTTKYYIRSFVVTQKNQTGYNPNIVEFMTEEFPERSITLGHLSETPGGFLDLDENIVYDASNTDNHGGGTAKPNADKIDIVHYHNPNGTYKATFFSPFYYSTEIASGSTSSYADINNWTVKNQTKFKKGSLSDYENASFESVQAANPTEDYASLLASGDVVFFKTTGGKYGIIKITQLVNPTKKTDEITLSYKIQQPSK